MKWEAQCHIGDGDEPTAFHNQTDVSGLFPKLRTCTALRERERSNAQVVQAIVRRLGALRVPSQIGTLILGENDVGRTRKCMNTRDGELAFGLKVISASFRIRFQRPTHGTTTAIAKLIGTDRKRAFNITTYYRLRKCCTSQ